MRRAYVETRHGQLHLREGGAGPALMLVHMTPLSGAMFVPAAAAFPGIRLLLPDLPGYGRSDPRGDPWSMADWADSLADLLAALGLDSIGLYGAHVGAAVALELAVRHPARVGRLMLDGLPFPTPRLQAAFAAIAAAPRPRTLAEALPRIEALLAELGGRDPLQAAIDCLETGFISSAPVTAAHDPGPALRAVRQPLCLLGAAADSQAESLARAQALRPDARCHCWPGPHPIHDPARAAEFAAPIRAFMGEAA